MRARASAAAHLVAQIERNLAIAQLIPEHGHRRDSLDQLQRWQRQRLQETYADLSTQPNLAPACDFFLDELYGGRDVHARDQQLQRVLPIMRRILSGRLLHAIGEAMRLQAVSLELDFELASLLPENAEIDQPGYAQAYRTQNRWSERREQIALICSLGKLLDDVVQQPMTRRLVRLMRRPAELSGAGLLQHFLERGMDAFSHLRGADSFLQAIETREMSALEAMESGASRPFEPWCTMA